MGFDRKRTGLWQAATVSAFVAEGIGAAVAGAEGEGAATVEVALQNLRNSQILPYLTNCDDKA